jgi:hypothetical protein
MKNLILTIVCALLLFGSSSVHAQEITGDDYLLLYHTNQPLTYQTYVDRTYEIRPILGCYFLDEPSLSNPNAGTISGRYVSNGRYYVNVRWTNEGSVFIRQKYRSFLDPWYETTSSKVVWVVKSQGSLTGVLDFGLTVNNSCPAPYTSISISRNTNPNIMKNWFMDISECTSTGGAVPGGAYWSRNWTTGNLYNLTLNSSNCNMNFQGNKYYKIKLATSTQNYGWMENSQVFQVKSGNAVPNFLLFQDKAPQLTGNGVTDFYNCSTSPMILVRLAVSAGKKYSDNSQAFGRLFLPSEG